MASQQLLEAAADPEALLSQREELTAFTITQLKLLVQTAKDEKVRLSALAELNKCLALGAWRPAATLRSSPKQTNNFYGATPSAPSEAAVALGARLDAASDAAERATDARDAVVATRAVLEALEDEDE